MTETMTTAAGPRGSGARAQLEKAPTGIKGFDEVTRGGLPKGRPTLVCGGAGCGKTLFAVEFLVHAALQFGEPGVFVAFEETRDDLVANVASMGYDLAKLEADKQLVIDRIDISRMEIQEAGDYDLEGLFLRLGVAINSVGAKRVVIDTVEVLFGVFTNAGVVRAELRRLLGWLKEQGVTVVITGERGDATLTRYGIEEYVSDCVVVLDHRVDEEQSTRRLRVAKYRGSLHGTNEYPFLIGAQGLAVLPITSLGLDHEALTERVSTGVPGLDAMLGGAGPFRASTVLVSGTAGAGKSTLAAHFVEAACRRGERALFIGFEESQSQIIRNMRSVGIDLATPLAGGLLRFDCQRSTSSGLEVHLAAMQDRVDEFAPAVVVIDAITNLARAGTGGQVTSMLTRQVDFLKSRGITAFLTSLVSGPDLGSSAEHVSSLTDTWVLIETVLRDGRRERRIQVIKARGTAHSDDVRSCEITGRGLSIAGGA